MPDAFDNYCIVELFGHQKISGRVTEHTIGGMPFVRVDVPETKRCPAFTRMFGAGAIYSITPVSEEIAIAAANTIYTEPVTVYLQLEAPDTGDEFNDDEER